MNDQSIMSMLQMMIDTGALRNGGVDISAEPPPTPPRYLAVYADETLTKGSEIPLEANTSAVVLDTLNIGFGQAVGLKYMNPTTNMFRILAPHNNRIYPPHTNEWGDHKYIICWRERNAVESHQSNTPKQAKLSGGAGFDEYDQDSAECADGITVTRTNNLLNGYLSQTTSQPVPFVQQPIVQQPSSSNAMFDFGGGYNMHDVMPMTPYASTSHMSRPMRPSLAIAATYGGAQGAMDYMKHQNFYGGGAQRNNFNPAFGRKFVRGKDTQYLTNMTGRSTYQRQQRPNPNYDSVGGVRKPLFKRLPPKVPNPVRCDVCNTTMNGPEPAAAHFAGAQHKARAAGLPWPPRRQPKVADDPSAMT